MSTKLKLMGVEVASFGDTSDGHGTAQPVTLEDPFRGVYKKLCVRPTAAAARRDPRRRCVGLRHAAGSLQERRAAAGFAQRPGPRRRIGSVAVKAPSALSDDAQVCSCNNVLAKGDLSAGSRKELDDRRPGEVVQREPAPGAADAFRMVPELLQAELKAARPRGQCPLREHFAFTGRSSSRSSSPAALRTFAELLAATAAGHGCESLQARGRVHPRQPLERAASSSSAATLQDTNDRFLANIQRDGSYSVIPRFRAAKSRPRS